MAGDEATYKMSPWIFSSGRYVPFVTFNPRICARVGRGACPGNAERYEVRYRLIERTHIADGPPSSGAVRDCLSVILVAATCLLAPMNANTDAISRGRRIVAIARSQVGLKQSRTSPTTYSVRCSITSGLKRRLGVVGGRARASSMRRGKRVCSDSVEDERRPFARRQHRAPPKAEGKQTNKGASSDRTLLPRPWHHTSALIPSYREMSSAR